MFCAQEEKKAKEEKDAVIAAAKKRGAEKAKLTKSLIIMDVKPWDDTTGKHLLWPRAPECHCTGSIQCCMCWPYGSDVKMAKALPQMPQLSVGLVGYCPSY